MIFENTYRFAIKLGTAYLYVNAGVVTSTPTPTYLQYAPENWEKISIKRARGWLYNGMFRTYTNTFNFVQDGAKILRWAQYLSGGIETPLVLVIEKYNRLAAVSAYEPFLECEIDGSTFSDSADKVSVNLIEGGFIGKLKARENTTYEMDVVNHLDVVWVKMHGIKLNCVLNWTMSGNMPNNFTVLVLPQTSFYNTIGINTSLSPLSVDPFTFQSFFLANNFGNVVPVDVALKTKISFNAIMDPGNSTDGVVKVVIQEQQISPQLFISNTTIFTQGSLAPGSTTQIDIDQIDLITLNDNRQLEFHIIVDDGAGGGATNAYQIDILNVPGGLEASFYSTVPVGYIPALRPQTVYEELISDISDNTTTATSDLLNTTHPDKVITSGDALRNLENSKLKISFSDFYKSINSALYASLYHDKAADEVFLEDKDSVFDDTTVIATLSGVNNFNCKPLTQEMASKLKAGFGSYTYDEINGKDEFNQATEFLLPFTRVTNDKDLTSAIRADMYGIEYTRLNLTDKKSTDADSDNDNFFIHIAGSSAGTVPAGYVGAGEPYYEVFRRTINLAPGPSHWEIENIMYPETAFNIFFSAKRQLQRWAGYMASILYLLDSLSIKFQAATKNNEDGLRMKTSEGALPVVIDEGSNELVSNYTPPTFLPYIFEFDFPDSESLAAALEATPHGVIRFPNKGKILEGFVLEIVSMPELQKQSATLLATTNNNLNDIVYA